MCANLCSETYPTIFSGQMATVVYKLYFRAKWRLLCIYEHHFSLEKKVFTTYQSDPKIDTSVVLKEHEGKISSCSTLVVKNAFVTITLSSFRMFKG